MAERLLYKAIELKKIGKSTNHKKDYPLVHDPASDKIESLENHNWRTRHSKNLVQWSFSSLSNSLETRFIYLFFLLP